MSEGTKQKKNILTGGLEKNQLIWNAIQRNYLPCFFVSLIYCVGGLVDSLLAGLFATAAYIAAVGIVTPINTLFGALLGILVSGTYQEYNSCVARGQRRKSREVISVGFILIFAAGFLFAGIIFVLREPLVILFGAANPTLQNISIPYLVINALSYPFAAAVRLFDLILNVHGHNREIMYSNAVGLVTNVIFSMLLMNMFPHLRLAALGIGTALSVVAMMGYSWFGVYRKRLFVFVKPRLAGFRPKRMKEMLSSGFGGSVDTLAETLVGALVNNIIVGSPLGVEGLAAYAVIQNFWVLSHVSAQASDLSSGSLATICIQLNDKRELINAYERTILKAIRNTIIWVGILYLTAPFILWIIYAETDIPNAWQTLHVGVTVTLLFAPAYTILYLLGSLYDNMGNAKENLRLAIVPDSIIYPILLALLIGRLGYMGIWLSLGGYTVVFLAAGYAIQTIKLRKWQLQLGEIIGDAPFSGAKAEVEVSVRNDLSEEAALSGKIHSFLLDRKAAGRMAYLISLCVEEITADIFERGKKDDFDPPERLNVKVIATEEEFMLLVVYESEAYNPLDFDYDGESFSKIGVRMIQKMADKIDYCYLYKINIITIRIGK